jgi:hypothetical protein
VRAREQGPENPRMVNGLGGRRINMELIRLLVHLQQVDIAGKLVAYARSAEPMEDRIHAAAYARYLKAPWTKQQREDLLDYGQSRLTEVPFVHYRYQFPNSGTRFLISGNYIVSVTEQA